MESAACRVDGLSISAAGSGHKPRLIARLDVKGPNVVKGIQFEGLRIMGDPDVLATRCYEQGADELLYIDTVASLYGRNNLIEVVQQAARHLFIPMTVGGGIRSLEDVRLLLRAGADKVAVNTAAAQDPSLIKEIAEAYGSQVLVVSIQAKQLTDGKWQVYTENGRQPSGLDVCEWAARAVDLGAGEILVTSIDRDGTGRGFDIELFQKLSGIVQSVPLLASGGARRPEHISDLLKEVRVDGIAVASMLHYGWSSVQEIKSHLFARGVATARH
ncbi:MAG: imidazole glycerol phosphate synthase subunit HisF [Spirochaetales bacterium]|nr:imidazole glycerol phosphate synthase subunit HisF [Spirochaetales bacterium]